MLHTYYLGKIIEGSDPERPLLSLAMRMPAFSAHADLTDLYKETVEIGKS